MSNRWDAEQLITPDLAKYLIESQFPNFAPAHLEFIGEGWDNFVYRVNHDYVFRFPRRKIGADFIAIEKKLLPNLGQRLPLPIPEPLFFGHSDTQYTWPFLGYRFLYGKSACGLSLSMQERIDLATPLAHFLKALHAISESQALELGAKHDHLGKLDIPFRWPKLKENLQKIKALGLFSKCDFLLKLLHNLKDITEAGPKVLVHGDLYARHMLINDSRELTGIIDWGDAHIGNPAEDLQLLFDFLPSNGRQLFLDSYGPIDKKTAQLALFRALCCTSALVLYSHDVGDKDLLTECLVGLELMTQSYFDSI
jgi:aminoglycoside phosphotransferase (APT) family kinase protein